MKKAADFNKFRDFVVNHCDKFFPEDVKTWYTRILVACMDDEKMMQDIQKYIDISDDISAEELDNTMQELRNKSNEYIKLCTNSTGDELFENFSNALVYYGLLESLDELASFANNLIQSIKNKYGENYLYVISQFDKGNLSIDTAKIADSVTFEDIDYNDELLKRYAVLKKWQDKQHGYYQTVIEPLLLKLEEQYRTDNPLPVDVSLNDIFVYRKFHNLCQRDIIDIDELAKFKFCGIDKELIKLIGGKAYGLTVLRSSGVTIPETKVIPVTSSLSNKDINKDLNPTQKYSVRSSADIEDGEKNSFAGMFDSYLDVSYEDIEENIQKVINSKNNERLQKYISKNNLQQPNMAVVVQKFVEPEYAGVWIGKDSESGYLEYVEGNGEKLVSGKVTPTREIWINGACKSKPLTSAEGEIGKLLLEFQNAVAKKGGSVADFEWMILDNHLVLLQYRPVTSKMDEFEYSDGDEDTIRGIPSSPGKVTAPCRFVNARYINELTDWHNGDILLSWYTDPEWMNILSNSSGIVTAVGGFLCHAAIIARELGIPCVIGIGPENMKKIWKEEMLTIDGDTGIIEPVKKKSPRQK